jgi:predicted RNA-binding Zn-ribbon protein involved in translation (DUF1610 family)
MFSRIRNALGRAFTKTKTVNDEPINKVSLVIIILIDIFILFNVFVGLDDISQWHLSPYQSYPCYADWRNYRDQTVEGKDYDIVSLTLSDASFNPTPFYQRYQQAENGHLGTVSAICLQYGSNQDQIVTAENQQIIHLIDQKQIEISNLEDTNRTIREQYDSTLLEQIAGQPPEQSINSVDAANARATLDQNNQTIATLQKEISDAKTTLLQKPESLAFLAFLNDDASFQQLEKSYDRASFWYPSIQFGFQAIFLIPLLIIALSIHRFAQQKGYGLLALLSWHLLVIFLIPLVLKIFQFLQVGFIFEFVFDVLKQLLRGLVFLVSYIYILIIPVIGFGLIKFFQKVVFNAKSQAANRIQKSRCIHCAKRIHVDHHYCPHCGYFQYTECNHCHELTYKYLPYCTHCGTAQPKLSNLNHSSQTNEV